jgi:hypothetical protein
LFGKFAANSNCMTFPEFVEVSTIWTGGKQDELLGMQFKLWDKYNDGMLDERCLEAALMYGMTEDATSILESLLQKVRDTGETISSQEFIYATRGKQMWPAGPGVPKWYFNTVTSRFAGGTTMSEPTQTHERRLLANGGWEWNRRVIQPETAGDAADSDAALAASLHKKLNGDVHSPSKKCEAITMVLRIPVGLIDLSVPKITIVTHVESGTVVHRGLKGNHTTLHLPGKILTEDNASTRAQAERENEARHAPARAQAAQIAASSSQHSSKRSKRRNRLSWLGCFGADNVQEPDATSNNSNSNSQVLSDCLHTEQQRTRERTDSVRSEDTVSTSTSSQGRKLSWDGEDLGDFTDSLQCPVCFENRVDTVLAPCSHWFCDECATKLYASGNGCAMCRGGARAVLSISFTDQAML